MLNYRNKLLTLLPASLLMTACATGALEHSDFKAPVENGRQSRTPVSSNEPARTTNIAQTQAASIGSVPTGSARTGSGTHTVAQGETLYRIAVNNGLKYQDLAQWNNLDGFNIKVGQVLRLTPQTNPPSATVTPAIRPAETVVSQAATVPGNNKQFPKGLKVPFSEIAVKQLPAQAEGGKLPTMPPAVVTPPVAATPPAVQAKPVQPPQVPGKAVPGTAPIQQTGKTEATPVTKNDESATAGSGDWLWPTEGKIVRGFSEQNKGINIAGKMGQAVLAANSGKVVYSGSGLRGYGKLVIIRHDKTYLSAYAHNSALMVKEGQSVKKGQKIAEMGDSDADQVKLHFEIRELGKPVDPAKYLGNRP